MMVKTSNKILTAALSLLLCVALISETFAWYLPIQADFGDTDITGSIKSSYFEHGSGTKDDPYIIARPVQLYNFAWLQYLGYLTNKDGSQVYVQLLDDSEYTGSDKVTSFLKDDGTPYSSGKDGNILYMDMDDYQYELPPIGTEASNAYSGNFNGNGKTISNLIVCSKIADPTSSGDVTVCDVGFFGFVTSAASVSNLYLDNITIDLTNASTATIAKHKGYKSVVAKTAPGVHTLSSGSNVCYVGYIAGHIEASTSFKNVYVNNCTISGGTTANSNYGYFGYAENTSSISKLTTDTISKVVKGDDYEFHMTANDLYSFLNTQNDGTTPTEGSKFSGYYLVTRNDAIAGTTDLSYDKSDKTMLTTALTAGSSSWVLNGSYPDNLHYRDSTKSNLYNFSFSKIGYYVQGDSYLPLYYKDDNNQYIEIVASNNPGLSGVKPEKTTGTGNYIYYDSGKYVYYNVTTPYSSDDTSTYYLYYGSSNTPLTDPVITAPKDTPPGECTTTGKYVYYDKTKKKWIYYICSSTYSAPKSVSVTFNSDSTYELPESFSNPSSYTYSARLYVDGNKVSTITGTLNKSGSTLSIPKFSFSNVSLESSATQAHHYAVIVTANVTVTSQQDHGPSQTTTTSYYYYDGTNTSNIVTESKTLSLTSDTASVSISLTSNKTTSLMHSGDGVSFESQAVAAKYTSYDLKYLNNGKYTALTDKSATFNFADSKWTVTIAKPAEYTGPYTVYYLDGENYVQLDTKPTADSSGILKYLKSGSKYLSDEFENYTSPTTNTVTGYDSDCIDIVGKMTITETKISVDGYQGDTYNLINNSTNSDLGTTFYGNAVNGGSDCLIVKIKNEGSDLGTFDIVYDWDSEGDNQFTRGSLSKPGSGSKNTVIGKGYKDSMDAELVSKTYNGTTFTTMEAKVTAENIVNCAYCGIDANGTIIAIPKIDTTKEQSAADQGGLIYQDGKDYDDVAYFVLMMGFTYGQNHYISRVDFEFKADSGDGGSSSIDEDTQLVSTTKVFEAIDYRSASDTRAYSLLNVEFIAPEAAAESTTLTESGGTIGVNPTFTYTIGYKDNLYTITILNKTSASLAMSVLLTDDDSDSTNTYPYSYKIVYKTATTETTLGPYKASYNFTALPSGISSGAS